MFDWQAVARNMDSSPDKNAGASECIRDPDQVTWHVWVSTDVLGSKA